MRIYQQEEEREDQMANSRTRTLTEAAIERDRQRRADARRAPVDGGAVAGTVATERMAKYEVVVLRPKYEVKEYVIANRAGAAMRHARAKYGKHGWAEFVCVVLPEDLHYCCGSCGEDGVITQPGVKDQGWPDYPAFTCASCIAKG